MNVYCDDGSTTIKLAWNDNGKICKSLSQNSFRHGWKVDGLGIRQTFNYELDGKKYTYDEVSNQSILTTHIEYQYTDVNLLAVHHALKSFQFVVEVHTLVFGEPSKLLIMIFISSLLMEEPSGSDQICSKLYVSAQTS